SSEKFIRTPEKFVSGSHQQPGNFFFSDIVFYRDGRLGRRRDAMYCSNCGRQLEEAARYCSSCGTARNPSVSKKLTRKREGKRIAGVCAGVARYLEVDVTLVRVIWLLLAIFPCIPAIIAYIVCWIVMPADPEPVVRPTDAVPRVAEN